MTAYLHSTAVAVPQYVLEQGEVVAHAREILAPRYPEFDRIARAFHTAGIDRRHSVVPIEWFRGTHGWAERNARYMEGATELFVQAAERALEAAGWTAEEVDCIVTVSSTGIATPTLEAQALVRMGFREDVLRVPVFGLGCAGGVSGAIVAQRMALAAPGDRVLMVAVETCSLAFRADRMQKADIIAAVLFADGAAALCLSTDRPEGQAVALGRPHQHTWRETLPIMGWDVDDTGLGVVFDRSIPDFVRSEFLPAAEAALARAGMRREKVDRFVCHPGGAKVVSALERVLRLEQGSLTDERAVLRDYGNMSSPTVIFVLDRVLRGGQSGRMMACAMGPGFTAAFLPLDVPERIAA